MPRDTVRGVIFLSKHRLYVVIQATQFFLLHHCHPKLYFDVEKVSGYVLISKMVAVISMVVSQLH